MERRTHRYSHRDSWSPERIVAAARDWADEFGGPPRSYDWCPGSARSAGLVGPAATAWERQHPRWPGNTTVYRYFDAWADLLEAAGLPPGPRRVAGPLAERVDAALRLHAAGLSAARIARELGVSPATAGRYLHAQPCGTCAAPVIGDGGRCQACATRAGNPKRWSGEEVMVAFAEWIRLEGRPPTAKDWSPRGERWTREYPRWPPVSAVRISLGATLNELRVLHDVPTYGVPWSREEIVEAIKRWHAEHGRAPTKHGWEVAPAGYPSAATVRRAFGGSFVAAVREAGIPPAWVRWDRDSIVAAIRAATDAAGRPPYSTEWTAAAPGRPTHGCVVKHFGSWSAAVAIAMGDGPRTR